MRSRESLVVAFSICGSLVAPAALATETRTRTLQSLSGIQDETDVFEFPGLVTSYQVALIELGTAQSEDLGTEANEDVYGAAFAGANKFAGGGAVSRDDWLISEPRISTQLSLLDRYEVAMTSEENDGPELPRPTRPFELLGAFDIGGGRSVGLRIGAATYKNNSESEEGVTKQKAKLLAEQLEMALGFSAPAGRGLMDFAFTTELIARQKRSEESVGVEGGSTVKGKKHYEFSARWLASKDASGAFAYATYIARGYKATTETAVNDESSTFDDSVILLEGGYAALAKERNARLYAGLDVASTTSKGPTVSGVGGAANPSYLERDDKAKVKGTLVSGALSGEADLNDKFGMMMGMRYALWGTIKEDDNTAGNEVKTEVSTDETPDASLWSLGLYYHWEALRVDASYSKAFLHNGPYLISGAQTDPLLGRISASYAF